MGGGGEGTNDEKPTETNDETGGGEGTNDEKPTETNDETGGETDVTNADNGDSADGAAVPHAAEQKIDEAIQKMNQLNDLFESIVQSLGGHTTTDTDDEANTAIKDTDITADEPAEPADPVEGDATEAPTADEPVEGGNGTAGDNGAGGDGNNEDSNDQAPGEATDNRCTSRN